MHDAVTVTLNPAIDRTATVPSFTAGEVNRATAVHDQPGGKGVNVAVALARACAVDSSKTARRIAATGFLGADNRAIFDEFFASAGIDNLFHSLPGATRIGIKIVDTTNAATTDLNFPGLPPSSADLAAITHLLLQTTSHAAHPASRPPPFYVLAGSLPPGVPVSIYADWTRALRARGARVAIDTSGDALAQALSASPTFIKPNLAELSALLGHSISDTPASVAAARALIARHGIALAVVSMGAGGACFVTARDALHARPPAIPIHSTAGAGDAMVAGIVHAMPPGLQGNEFSDTPVAGLLTPPALENIARQATAFSLATLARTGTAATFRDAIAHYAPQVTLHRLSS